MRWKPIWSILTLVSGTGAVAAQTVPPPEIESSSDGSYVIWYTPCQDCYADGLEEYQPETQKWRYIGSGLQGFGSRADGTYRYRVVYAYQSSTGDISTRRSTVTAVTIGSADDGVVVEAPVISEQLKFRYAALAGDINGDGRADLLIRRQTDPDNPYPGTISELLLVQKSDGSFAARIPTQNDLNLAQGFFRARAKLRTRDVNIDGYADLVLAGLAKVAGFRNSANQVVFAPGAGVADVPRLLPVDSDLARFSGDINRHLLDPEYYPNNAPLNYAVISYYSLECSWGGYGSPTDFYYSWPCYLDRHYLYYVYRDVSAFDPDAMAIAQQDYGILHGQVSPEQGFGKIADGLEKRLGVTIGGWDLNEIMGKHPVSDADERRGMELFAVLAGISEAVAQQAGDEGAPSVIEQVEIRGRRVLGQGPFHTAVTFRRATLSAYDSISNPLIDGFLVSRPNWPPDHPALTMRLGYVNGPGDPSLYWERLRTADRAYGDDLRYDLFPSLGQGGYNSNSYTSGLIQATLGVPTIEMSSFVGGERPVPPGEFN